MGVICCLTIRDYSEYRADQSKLLRDFQSFSSFALAIVLMSQKIIVYFTPDIGAHMRRSGISRGKVKKSHDHCSQKIVAPPAPAWWRRKNRSSQDRLPLWRLAHFSFGALDLTCAFFLLFCAVRLHPLQASGDLRQRAAQLPLARQCEEVFQVSLWKQNCLPRQAPPKALQV